jgi:hypothetical protein
VKDMIRRKLGVAALALTSVFGLSTAAMARDHDDYRAYNRGYYGGLSSHERHEVEERRAREAREAQRTWEMQRRRAAVNNNYYYGGGYNGPSNNGYYDRLGYWHAYR